MKIAILSLKPDLYSTRRLVEAAVQKGHKADVYSHLHCYMGLKKGKPTIHHEGKDITEVDAIIPRIGASVTFYGTAVVRQFEMMDVFCANGSVAITRSRDKLRSMQYFARDGVGMPNTAFAHNTNNIDDLLKMAGGLPVIIKLLEGTQGIGVMLAETKKAAKAILEAFQGLDKNVLVQEFIQEAKGADIRAIVVGNKVVGAMKRQAADGEFRSNLHRGGTAIQVELSEEEEETAIKAAQSMGLSIAGVDLLQSERGPLVIEVNSSPGLEGIEKATKKDIAGFIIDYVAEMASQNKPEDKRP